jgi:hypothetical protein
MSFGFSRRMDGKPSRNVYGREKIKKQVFPRYIVPFFSGQAALNYLILDLGRYSLLSCKLYICKQRTNECNISECSVFFILPTLLFS